MALPADIPTITVTGHYTDATGAPSSGEIRFSLSATLYDTAGNVVLTQVDVVAELSAGSLSVAIPVTDNQNLVPQNWYYTVSELIDGATVPRNVRYVQVPSTLGPAADITALPQVTPGDLARGVVTTVDGLSGDVVLSAKYAKLDTTGHLDSSQMPTIDYPVTSVNGHTGEVTLTVADVGALSAGLRGAANGVASLDGTGKVPLTQLPTYVTSVNGATGEVILAANDVGALATSARGAVSGVAALDATGKVPTAQLPTYPTVPVQSVNSKTGAVVLTAADVGALPTSYTPPAPPVTSVNGETGDVALTSADVGAIPTTQKAQPNGVASLNSAGQVPIAQSRVASVDGQTGDVVLDYAIEADITSAVAAHVAATDPHGDRAYADAQFIEQSQAGAANGVAQLGADGKLITSQVPAVAITNTYVVGTEAEMLALTANQGDIAVRTDLSETFILAHGDPTVLADWQWLEAPTGGVVSVNGQQGVVNLGAADVGAVAVGAVGTANGVAALGSDGLVPTAQLPPYPTVPVQSVNGHTGVVALTAADVGALPDTYTPPAAPVSSVNGETGDVVLSAADVGALTQTQADARYALSSALGAASGIATLGTDGILTASQRPAITFPVTTVNGQTGDVMLAATDLGAETPTGAQAKADAAQTAAVTTAEAYTDTSFASAIPLTQKGANNGVATLDASGVLTSSQAPVGSVNGKTGLVVLSASDVNALATNAPGTVNLPSAASTGVVGTTSPGVVLNIGGASNDPNDIFTQGWRINVPADPAGFTRSNANGAKGTGNGAADVWSVYFNGQQTGYGNELGELRANAGKTSTIAFRAKAFAGTSDGRKIIDATDSTGTAQGAIHNGGLLTLKQRTTVAPTDTLSLPSGCQQIYTKTDGAVYTQSATAERQLATVQERVATVAASGTAQTLPDVTTATQNDITLTGNCTLTLPTAGAGKSLMIVLRQGGTGSYTVTWPATVKWASGTAPTLSTAVGKADVVSLVCIDGTNWLGFLAGADMR